MSTERVQKILAQTGIASRRKAEELITEGLVTINGKVAKLGDKAELGKDAIKVKGKLLQAKVEEPMYLAFNKPMGVISMLADPQGRPTLADFLTKIHTRIFPIGRLDFNSEGLIILTNDGTLTEALQKRDDIPRVYHVKVRGHVTHEMLQRLVRGMRMDRKIVKPHSVRVVQEMAAKSRIEIVFLNAGVVDVKAFFEQKGFLIERMTRTAIGHLTTSGIEPGQYKMLDKSQVDALLAQPELGLKKLEANIAKAKPLRGREERIEGEMVAEELRKSGKPRQVVRPLFSAPRGASKISGAFGDRQRSDELDRENGTAGRSGVSKKFGERKFGDSGAAKGPRIAPSSARSTARPLVSPLASPRKQEFDPSDISKTSSYAARRGTWGEAATSREKRPSSKPSFGSKPAFGDKRPTTFGDKRPASGAKRFDQFREGAPAKPFGREDSAPASRRTAARDKYFLGEKTEKKFGAKEYGEKKFGKERASTPRGPSARTMSRAGSKPAPVFSGPGTRGAGRNPSVRRTKPSR